MAPAAVATLFPFEERSLRNDALVEEYYSPGLRHRFNVDASKIPITKPISQEPVDISYDANEAKYLARVKKRVAAGGLETTVPEGWPTAVEGPLVWDKDTFQDSSEYIYYLTEEDKAEIQEALEYFKG